MELGWTVLVMTPKDNSGVWGVGLLEVVCKLVEAVIDTRINTVVQFHDVLHRSCAARRERTEIMELKLHPAETSTIFPNPT